MTANPDLLSNLSFINQKTLIPPSTNQTNNISPSSITKKADIKIVSPDGGTVKATVNIEVADSPELRGKGLGYRNSLGPDSGMLFMFDELRIYKFWMKGMRFPLDMLWIKDDTIVDIIKDVPNPSPNTPDRELQVYGPSDPINRILEVNAGYSDSHGITVGDKLVEVH